MTNLEELKENKVINDFEKAEATYFSTPKYIAYEKARDALDATDEWKAYLETDDGSKEENDTYCAAQATPEYKALDKADNVLKASDEHKAWKPVFDKSVVIELGTFGDFIEIV